MTAPKRQNPRSTLPPSTLNHDLQPPYVSFPLTPPSTLTHNFTHPSPKPTAISPPQTPSSTTTAPSPLYTNRRPRVFSASTALQLFQSSCTATSLHREPPRVPDTLSTAANTAILSLSLSLPSVIMAASLLGGAAVGAVFGELLKSVLEIKNKSTIFKQTLIDLQSTLVAIAPVVKEIEQHNNDLGRPKEELESLIRKMEEGIKLVYDCSKIRRYNYVAKFRYQEQLVALADSLVKFFIIDMQAQAARDQKETLLTVRRILSNVNKLPLVNREDTMASSSDCAPMPDDVSESETNYSSAMETFSVEEAMEHIDQVTRSSSSDSDTVPVYVSESGSTAIQQAEDSAGANSAGKVMEAVQRYVWFTGLVWFSRSHWKRRRKRGGGTSDEIPIKNLKRSSRHLKEQRKNATHVDNSGDVHYFSLSKIKVATNYFSNEAKLGEGGFGPVFKGKLVNGKEIAVKRLSSQSSWQGLEEFKNEVLLMGKLQHRNVVRILGYCLDENEKLLVYEYMANTSVDAFLSGPTKRIELDWPKRAKIINGIAKGLAYLHEDSRLKIIHRDLKASNVLLDEDMNPKISDFGTARIFCENQNEASTNRIVGTYGYMAPEYALEGIFSVKSDVYSFGVLMLEIMSGRKNSGFYQPERGCGQSLLSYAWQLWSEGKGLEFMDPVLVNACHADEALRWIHIGLFCVQERPKDRPTISSVIFMLGSTINLPLPPAPPFSVG